MIKFKGLIAPTDVPTGDGRMFAAGKMTHRPLPIPVMARFGSGGHDGAVPVAKIVKIYPGPGGYWGEGTFLDPAHAPEVPRAIYMVKEKVLGPSVDLDRDFTVKAVPHPSRPDKKAALFEEYNVIGTTLVPMPAFHQVHMSIETEEEKSLLASAGVDLSWFLSPDEFAVEAGAELMINEQMINDGMHVDATPLLPFTVPGIADPIAQIMIDWLQYLLGSLSKLALELKHAHWNVTGPNFMDVHEMLGKMAGCTWQKVDEIAERIAALGGSPNGTVGAIYAAQHGEDNYPYMRADAMVHLGYLDGCYTKAIKKMREICHRITDLDLVTQDMLTGQLQQLEKQQWFIRAHFNRAQSAPLATSYSIQIPAE